MKLKEEMGDKKGIALILNNFAMIYADKGDDDRKFKIQGHKKTKVIEDDFDKEHRDMLVNKIMSSSRMSDMELILIFGE